MILEKTFKHCTECEDDFKLSEVHCEKCHISDTMDIIHMHDCKGDDQ